MIPNEIKCHLRFLVFNEEEVECCKEEIIQHWNYTFLLVDESIEFLLPRSIQHNVRDV